MVQETYVLARFSRPISSDLGDPRLVQYENPVLPLATP